MMLQNDLQLVKIDASNEIESKQTNNKSITLSNNLC